jgi:NAD(P)-dependent dehydrogenase (short-subunit alcohol dehydrogenase family)
VRDEIAASGGECAGAHGDTPTTRHRYAKLAVSVAAAVGHLDIFVANAASLGARLPLVKYPLDVWQHTFRTNVEANLVLLQELDPLLKASEAPRIIMCRQGSARQGKATTGSYAVSKAALEAMVRIYAVEAAGTPTRINVVNPGPTRTDDARAGCTGRGSRHSEDP